MDKAVVKTLVRKSIYLAIAITAFTSISNGQKSVVKPRKASILYCDSSRLNSYKTELSKDISRWDSAFIRNFFSIIHKFNGKPLDTTVITTGKLDEMGRLCKIRTRVYLYDSTIFVESRLTMNHKLLWKYSFKDPWGGDRVGQPKLFDWETRNPWVFFTCGIYGAPPEFENYKSMRLQMEKSFPPNGGITIDYGVSDLKKKGFSITKKQYSDYLNNFKGDLFAYGDFISKERLYIWYSPAKCFILFYAP